MISIITATYNRSYIIGELYNSLCRQTSYDFEWIVVDDGSTDNIKEIMSVCIKDESVQSFQYISFSSQMVENIEQ